MHKNSYLGTKLQKQLQCAITIIKPVLDQKLIIKRVLQSCFYTPLDYLGKYLECQRRLVNKSVSI